MPPSSSRLGVRLEREPGAELAAARSNCGPSSRQGAVDNSEVPQVINVTVWWLKAGMVQRVDKIGPQLQTEALPKVEFLSQGQVDYTEAWPTHSISTLRPEGEGGFIRMREGSRVEIVARRNIGKGVADSVEIKCAVVATLRVVIWAAVNDSEGISTLLDERSRDSPPARDNVRYFIMVEILLVLPERQLVGDDALEGVWDVKVGIAVVGPRVIPDLPALRAAAAAPSRRILLVQEVRPDVVDLKGQAGRIALRNPELQSIVS